MTQEKHRADDLRRRISELKTVKNPLQSFPLAVALFDDIIDFQIDIVNRAENAAKIIIDNAMYLDEVEAAE
mgnify:CR=1 FL=1